ncbi:MAG: Rho termination factor N-terminal domain-containing protein [Planctomycetota bacterium]
MSQNSSSNPESDGRVISGLPLDELRHYGNELGLELPSAASKEEWVERIRERQALLIELDRSALLDIIVWARLPVRKSANKEELARQIAQVRSTNYRSLSNAGLVTLARLRGVPTGAFGNSEDIIAELHRQDGFWRRLGRKRRWLAGTVVSWLVERSRQGEDSEEYQFLPEEQAAAKNGRASESLKRQIEDRGVVGGLANRLRGAADDYIRVKLDEIEARIDSKLDDIDKRLGEWRDREVANRLKILRITLMFTVLVAVISLGYNCLKTNVVSDAGPSTQPSHVQPVDPDR